jgi:hypothetical protein
MSIEEKLEIAKHWEKIVPYLSLAYHDCAHIKEADREPECPSCKVIILIRQMNRLVYPTTDKWESARPG